MILSETEKRKIEEEEKYRAQVRKQHYPLSTSRTVRNRVVAALLAIFLGGLGIHKFYLGKTGWGILYLLFFWTGIPLLVGFIEGIIYLASSEKSFQDKYSSEQKKEMGCLKAIGIVFGVIILGSVIAVSLSNKSNSNLSTNKLSENLATNSKTGKFLDYNYTILSSNDSSKYTATFTPFLPRNDGIVIAAMTNLINDTYGKNTLKNLQPRVIEKDGVNVFRFDATDGYYYFTSVKEDTGEIHSFVFWKE